MMEICRVSVCEDWIRFLLVREIDFFHILSPADIELLQGLNYIDVLL